MYYLVLIKPDEQIYLLRQTVREGLKIQSFQVTNFSSFGSMWTGVEHALRATADVVSSAELQQESSTFPKVDLSELTLLRYKQDAEAFIETNAEILRPFCRWVAVMHLGSRETKAKYDLQDMHTPSPLTGLMSALTKILAHQKQLYSLYPEVELDLQTAGPTKAYVDFAYGGVQVTLTLTVADNRALLGSITRTPRTSTAVEVKETLCGTCVLSTPNSIVYLSKVLAAKLQESFV